MVVIAKHIKRLERIIESSKELLEQMKACEEPLPKRKRRAGRELIEFRRMLKYEFENGASAAQLAKDHGVSAAYIYQLSSGRFSVHPQAKRDDVKVKRLKVLRRRKSQAKPLGNRMASRPLLRGASAAQR